MRAAAALAVRQAPMTTRMKTRMRTRRHLMMTMMMTTRAAAAMRAAAMTTTMTHQRTARRPGSGASMKLGCGSATATATAAAAAATWLRLTVLCCTSAPASAAPAVKAVGTPGCCPSGSRSHRAALTHLLHSWPRGCRQNQDSGQHPPDQRAGMWCTDFTTLTSQHVVQQLPTATGSAHHRLASCVVASLSSDAA